MAEPNKMAREAAKITALSTIGASALLFVIRPFIQNGWLKIVIVILIAYEIFTMATNQYVAFRDSASPQVNNSQQIDNVKEEISQLEQDARSLRNNGVNEGNSKYSMSRAHGGELLDKASSKTNQITEKRKELRGLIGNQKTTFGTVLPDWVLKVKCIARALLLPGIIASCFYIIGVVIYYLSNKASAPSPFNDSSDPKGKRPTLDKKDDKPSSFMPDLSKNGQTISGKHCLSLVMQEEEKGCGIACIAMIFDESFHKSKFGYTGNYDDTGTNTKEIIEYLNSKGLKTKFLEENLNVSSLSEIASTDVLFISVKQKSGCMHGCLFEKGYVYCPFDGLMTEEEAFKGWQEANVLALIKCEDIIEWRKNNKNHVSDIHDGEMNPDGALPSPISASLDSPKFIQIPKDSRALIALENYEKNLTEKSKPQEHLPNFPGTTGTVNLLKHDHPTSLKNKESESVEVFWFENTKNGTQNAKRRDAESHDTGTVKGKNLRYKTIAQKIKKGEISPSIRSVKKAGNCDYDTAAKYLSDMHKRGILDRLEDGTYKLVVKRPKLKVV